MIQVRRMGKLSTLEIIGLLENNDIIAKRIFPVSIDYLHVSGKFIYVINQQFLYIFDLELNPLELPLKVGQIHKFLSGNSG